MSATKTTKTWKCPNPGCDTAVQVTDRSNGLVEAISRLVQEYHEPTCEHRLPLEPPMWAVVQVSLAQAPEADVILRRYPHGWAAPGAESDTFRTWAQVCAMGTVTVLVPKPPEPGRPVLNPNEGRS